MTIGRYQRIYRPIPITGKTAYNRLILIIGASLISGHLCNSKLFGPVVINFVNATQFKYRQLLLMTE